MLTLIVAGIAVLLALMVFLMFVKFFPRTAGTLFIVIGLIAALRYLVLL